MIAFENFTFGYDLQAQPVLRGLDLRVAEGDLAVVIGRTGTGKSTLLRAVNGLVPHLTGGRVGGEVVVAGHPVSRRRPRDLAHLVGYVGQDPLAGFVTDTVEEEIAYGMEQLGLPETVMRKRVEETLDLLDLAGLRRRTLSTLSSGQQQRVALAAVLAAGPRVLVLDEPTSALDPAAAQDVLAAITTLVHEVGLTVVLAEHRLERVMHAVDTVLWLPGDGGARSGPPAEVFAEADVRPPLAELAAELGWSRVPLSVRDARRRVHRERVEVAAPAERVVPRRTGTGLQVRGLRVAYGGLPALAGVDLDLEPGTVTTLMGRNGAGKSTLLWAVQGSGRRDGGQVRLTPPTGPPLDPARLGPRRARRHVTLVPQEAADLLYLDSVAAELARADVESDAESGAAAAVLRGLGVVLDAERHPRDLSEGQRLALVLAVQLTARPGVLLLDEPTRGLDYGAKDHLRDVLRGLADDGATILVSTHDVEFAARVGDRTVVLADGEVLTSGTTREILTASPVFAPQVAKVFAPTPVLTVAEVAR